MNADEQRVTAGETAQATTPPKTAQPDRGKQMEMGMGCDIHTYVEYSRNGQYWRNLTNKVGDRNYWMFGIMAGVRAEDLKLFEPKGLPDGPLGYLTENDYWHSIAPAGNPEWANLEGFCSRETAEGWISRGYSKGDYKDGVLRRVSDPDSHTHSWLTTAELQQCVDRFRELEGTNGRAPSEWVGILAAMHAIEANGDQTRIVFWFDN